MLSVHLQLARLLALSHGETRLSAQRWAAMRALEARREARLRIVRA
jgi:Mini-chromosome maintenance replisome factor